MGGNSDELMVLLEVDIDADPDAEVNMMGKEHTTLESAQRAKLVMTNMAVPQDSVYMQKRQ